MVYSQAVSDVEPWGTPDVQEPTPDQEGSSIVFACLFFFFSFLGRPDFDATVRPSVAPLAVRPSAQGIVLLASLWQTATRFLAKIQ